AARRSRGRPHVFQVRDHHVGGAHLPAEHLRVDHTREDTHTVQLIRVTPTGAMRQPHLHPVATLSQRTQQIVRGPLGARIVMRRVGMHPRENPQLNPPSLRSFLRSCDTGPASYAPHPSTTPPSPHPGTPADTSTGRSSPM